MSGEDLSWFWRAFFYGTDILDIAGDGVSMEQSGGQTFAEIHLRRVTSVPFPVTMRLKLNDGTTQDVHLPVQIWAHGDRNTAAIAVASPVLGVRLWPDAAVPDWNPSNDVWGDAPPASGLMPSTRGGAVPPIAASRTRP